LCETFGIADDEPATLASLDGARIAICRSPVWDLAEQSTRDALDLCADLLRAHGAEVTRLDLPENFDGLTAAHKVIMQSEMRSTFRPEFVAFGDALYPELLANMRNQSGFSRADLRAAYNLAAACRTHFDELAADYAAVLTPSAAGEAPVGLEDTGAATFNRIWTVLHAPCVNVPGLKGPNGMPVGVTMTGPRFRDRRVLEAARLLGVLLDGQTPEGRP